MAARHRRLIIILTAGAILSLAVFLALRGFSASITYFRTPSQILEAGIEPQRVLRLGGVVEAGTYGVSGMTHAFVLGDDRATLQVRYEGVPPDLFREGQCIIATGKFEVDAGADSVLIASRLLARHDESYVPREMSDAPRLAERCTPS